MSYAVAARNVFARRALRTSTYAPNPTLHARRAPALPSGPCRQQRTCTASGSAACQCSSGSAHLYSGAHICGSLAGSPSLQRHTHQRVTRSPDQLTQMPSHCTLAAAVRRPHAAERSGAARRRSARCMSSDTKDRLVIFDTTLRDGEQVSTGAREEGKRACGELCDTWPREARSRQDAAWFSIAAARSPPAPR